MELTSLLSILGMLAMFLVVGLALAADKKTEYTEGVELPIKVYQTTKIYAGGMVCVRADGYAIPGADSTGLIFMGIAREYVDNSLGSSGDKEVLLRRRGLFKMTFHTAISIANMGDNVFIYDDAEVDVAGNVTFDIYVGNIAKYIDTTHAWVDIEPAIKQADVAVHIADPTAAHAASAISIADAGDHFAAAEATVEAALQKLAKTIPLNFAVGTIATAASDAKIAEDFELPIPVRIKRAYATLGTAPGGGKTLTIEIKVGAGADATLCTVADTATKGEAENLDIAIAADTDFDIQLTQDSGAAADLNLMLIAQVDDGE
jgi:hypothetical protein